jgi:hypothetical protein
MRAWPIAFGLMTAVSLAASAAEPATENSITTVKRELDALKSSNSGTPAQKNEIPGLPMPALRMGEAEVPVVPRSGSKATAPQKKTGNWLIEAMEKKSDGAKSDRRRNASEPNFFTDEEDVTAEVENTRSEKTPAEKGERLPGTNLNPLDRYMGEWMTANDLAVLLPNLAATGRTEGTRPVDAASSAFAGDALTRNTLDAALGIRGVAVQLKENTPRENPFLQALDLPPTPTGRSSAPAPLPTTSPQPTRPPLFSPTPPPENAAAKTGTPDFAKPGSDEKYFKQLKRF